MLLAKALVYRVLRILLLLVTAYLVIGNIEEAMSISAIDAVVATVYYYYFDKAWCSLSSRVEDRKLRKRKI